LPGFTYKPSFAIAPTAVEKYCILHNAQSLRWADVLLAVHGKKSIIPVGGTFHDIYNENVYKIKLYKWATEICIHFYYFYPTFS
jgi:hypothetical protein